jgi:eukaryotic-like serine/threonine-protein kinase
MDRGDVVGERFALQQLVAGGGMGAVYRALDRSTGRPVAVKVLRAPRGSSAARFNRETRILSAIDHPLVVR